jgi:hypothetical protein
MTPRIWKIIGHGSRAGRLVTGERTDAQARDDRRSRASSIARTD